MLRRMLAITLLIAFGSPLALPLFAATVDPEASLPACCRTHGAHHCAMMHRMLAQSGGPALQAPPCADYPTATTPSRIAAASLAAPLLLSVEHIRIPAPLATPSDRALIFTTSANPKRGPPSRLA